jgi:probable HAF family extracellular repeat protein
MKTAFSAKAAVWFAATLLSSSAVSGTLYTFTAIDGPKPGQNDGEYTYVQGISDTHIIVGYAQPDSPCSNSFIFENGIGTTLEIARPESWPGPVCMRAHGVNNSGHVVGVYGDATVQGNGFLYHDGVFTHIGTQKLPPFLPLPRTMPQGISNSGLIVGNYQDSRGEHGFGEHAFVDISGYTLTFDVPGALKTYAHGINDIGQVAGTYEDADGQHGYVNYWGQFRRLNFPGSQGTMANGINDFGTVVGTYRLVPHPEAIGEQHGFVYMGGVYVPFDVPLGEDTVLTGINNRGQIVGSSFFPPYDTKPRHGFVADPVTLVEVANGVIHPNAGVVKVTIPSTRKFDAVANVDVSSLTFGRLGTETSLMSCQVLPGIFGSGNLRCTFSVPAAEIACSDARVYMNGRLLDGSPIRGSDQVRVREAQQSSRIHRAVPCDATE